MTTVTKAVKFTGKGIHSGAPVTMTVRPRAARGIVFRRTDIKGSGDIIARYDNVGETKMRNTTIGDMRGAHVQTIEHVMAALFMAGVDAAVVDIDGPETPILDGSAAIFFDKISAAVDTPADMMRIVVRRRVVAHAREIVRTLPRMARIKLWFFNLISGRRADGYVELAPNDGKTLDIRATLVYREKIIGTQSYDYSFDGTKRAATNFVKNIARARTFGKYSEWEYLKARGMARGADETNIIALNDAGDATLNATIWPDEFVRHKIIDALGDMFTSGGFVLGKLTTYKGSHALNNLVLKKLFSDANNYDIINPKDKK